MSRRDEAAFTDFVRGASPQLLRTAWLLTGSRAGAEDLVQAAFERVYVAWSRIDQASALGYTRRIIVNLHIDTGRRRRRERLTDDVPDQWSPDQAENIAVAEHLSKALAILPRRERHCVVLRFHAETGTRTKVRAPDWARSGHAAGSSAQQDESRRRGANP